MLAGGLFRHYRMRRELLRQSREALLGPPFEHPILGLGGQSIELSLYVGHEVSPDAVVLAVDALHDLVEARRAGIPDGGSTPALELDAATFLEGVASTLEIPSDTLSTLAADSRYLSPSD
jgi:hypothetical protein